MSVKSLGRSSAYAALAQIWRIGSRFVLTPIIIARIGLDGYGTWVLLFSICDYVSSFNATASLAYIKFTAEYDRKRDYESLSRIISTGVVLIGVLGTLALAGIWLAHDPIFRLVKIPEHLVADAGLALLFIMASVLLRTTFGCAFQILEGLQRMDLRYKMTILASAFEFVFAISLLLAGYGLTALAFAHFCGQVLATSVAWFLCSRLCPSLRLSPFLVSRAAVGELVSLAGRFQVSSLLVTTYITGRRVVISSLCGTSLLGVYELASKLLGLTQNLSGTVIAPLMPAFANLHYAEDNKKWRDLYVMSSKALVFLAVIGFSALVVFADQVILAWTGNEYDLAAWSIRAMFIGFFIHLMTGVGTASLRGQGSVRLEIYLNINTVVLTAMTIFPAYSWGGFKGLIMAITASLVVSSLWFLLVYSRDLGGSLIRELGKVLLSSGVIGGGFIAAGLLLRPFVDQFVPAWPLRWSAVFEVLAWGFLFSAITAVALWYSIFSKAERQYLARKLLRAPDKRVQLI